MRLRPQEVIKKPTRKAQGQKAMTPDDIVLDVPPNVRYWG